MFRLAILRATVFFAFVLMGPVVSDQALAQYQAGVHVTVSKATQRMTVYVDGKPRYNWAVSTGLNGGPPTGSFRPQRLERMWHSRTYDWSPMPHSIFFYHGFAIHGTNYVSRLGSRASHGCVRLAPANAATLFALVKERGMRSTTIDIMDYAPRMASR
jgi:lipoprotein-anchoring transpeptidase ErfK/SrfK